MSTRSLLLTAVALVPATAGLAGAAPAAGAKKAPPKITASPSTVAPGGKLAIRYSVRTAPARLVLRLRGPRKPVTLAKRTVKAKRGRFTVTVPATLPPGAYKLEACLGGACKATPTRVRERPSPPPAPLPPATPAEPSMLAPADPPAAPAPPPAPVLAPDVDFTGPGNPLDVAAHTDVTRRSTKTIGAQGGSLATTGADGTTYTLTIPQGALLSPEEIAMEPVTAIDGLPLSGGLVAAVQLEPSGLRFALPVTVEITGHPPVDPRAETGFLYQQDGKELQLHPMVRDARRTAFQILHFSGVGVGRGTDADRGAQLLRLTTDAEGRLVQALNEMARQDRLHQLTGEGAPLDPAQMRSLFRQYHDEALAGLMSQARTDDGLALQAINAYFGWDRLINLLLGDDELLAERMARQEDMFEVVRNAAVKVHRRCVDEHRPEELPMILAWWRTIALLGIEDRMPGDAWSAIRGCARFELDFETELRQEWPGGGPEGPQIFRGHAKAQGVVIEPDGLTLEQRGAGLADYLDFEITIPPHEGGTGCWLGSGEWDSTFPLEVLRVLMDLNPIQRPDGSYGYPELDRGEITVEVQPFSPREWVFYADCNGTGGGHWDNWLGLTFQELHEDEAGEYGAIAVKDWTAGTGSVMGVRTYVRITEHYGLPTQENTTIVLRHAPVG